MPITCCFFNPDAIVRPGFRVAMLQAAGRYEDAGVFGPRIIGPRNELFFPTRSLLSPYLINERKRACQPEGDCCAPFLSGSCYLIRRAFFIDIGGFDSNIFLFYEDNDLCRRVADTGRSIIFVNDAVMEHAQGRSSAPAPGRAFRARWHYAWSQGYVCRKYGLKSPSPGTFLRNSLKYFATLLTGSSLKRERYGGAAAGAWGLDDRAVCVGPGGTELTGVRWQTSTITPSHGGKCFRTFLPASKDCST